MLKSPEAYFLIAVTLLSILLQLNVSTGTAARISQNSILEATLTQNPKILCSYLTACTALASIGFVELVSHVFARIVGIKQSSFEQRDRGAIMSMVSIVPIIAVVCASGGQKTSLPIIFAFINSILSCGHSYSLLKILGCAYPSIFNKIRTQMLSIAVYLAMIGWMIGFGKDVMYWSNAISVVVLVVAFISPSTFLLWQVVLTYDYLNKKFSSYSSEEAYTVFLVSLYLTGVPSIHLFL